MAIEEVAPEPISNEPVVHVTYELSGADYRSATIELSQQSVTMVAVGTFAVVLSVIPILNGDLASVGFMLLGASFLTGVYCLPFIWWAIRRRSDLLLSRHDLTVDAGGIRIETPMTSSHQSWPTFRRVRELTEVFTLDYGTGANAMIPKRALDPAAEASFRELIQSRGLLQTPARWANFARGAGLGALAAVTLVVVIAIQANAGP